MSEPKQRPAGDPTVPLTVENGAGGADEAWLEAPEPEVLAPGEVIAERFKILNFLAAGGMGQVYEAEDLELHERVALKTVLPQLAEQPGVMARFRKEINLARKVTHPNVCRIYDVFSTVRADPSGEAGKGGRQQRLTFLTMEFLAGETLTALLRREGPLTPERALPLVEQMAAALHAAHEAGVVHRDFKSPNVMLVRSPRREGKLRVVVTDFGLARQAAGEGGETVTSGGPMIGTPAYMAPEQVGGGEVTPATDVYALGVVIYEMVTGRRPFSGGPGWKLAAMRLLTPPTPPRTYRPDLDPLWEAVLLKCLEREPENRFSSTPEVVQALRGELPPERWGRSPGIAALAEASGTARLTDVSASGPRDERREGPGGARTGAVPSAEMSVATATQPGARPAGPERDAGACGRPRSGRALPVPLAAALLVAVAAAGDPWRGPGLLRGQDGGGGLRPRRSVAVLGFRNLAGRKDAVWLSTALAEMLGTELAAGERLRVISGENVARMKIELSLADTDSLAKDTLARVRANLRADLVVLGSYVALGEQSGGRLRLDIRLQNASAGETIAWVAETGTLAELPELVSRVGARLRERLGVANVSEAEVGLARASQVQNPQAAKLYAEGLARLRLFDALAARKLLERAIAADPTHPFPHAALAAAWQALGYDARAESEAKRAVQLSSKLSRHDRLRVEALYHETRKDWGKAIRTYRSLRQLYPDDPEPALRLAAAQTAAARGREALATVAKMRSMGPLSQDPRVDLEEARAAAALSDFQRQREAALRAADKARQLGARLLVARARIEEGRALRRLSNYEGARAALEQAQQMYQAGGDRGGVALALNYIAGTYGAAGQHSEARKLYERALALRREIGDEVGTGATLNNLAAANYFLGNLAEARRLAEEALTIEPVIRNLHDAAYALNNIATVAFRQAKLEEAGRLYAQAAKYNRQVGNRFGLSYSVYGLGKVAEATGDLVAARRHHEEALAMRRQTGVRARVPDSLVQLVALLLDEQRWAEAERAAREAIAESRREGVPHSEALALAYLAQTLVAQPASPRPPAMAAAKREEAARAVERALALMQKHEYRGGRMAVTIEASRVRGRLGDHDAARTALKAVRDEAQASGHVGYAMEARFALAELDVAAGRGTEAGAALLALVREAEALGWKQLARRAEALLQRSGAGEPGRRRGAAR